MTDRGQESRTALLEQAIRLKKARARTAPRPGVATMERRSADTPPRLGPLQRSLWLAQRLEPGSAAYNLVSAFRVWGELDKAVLEQALSHIVARHRILRSTFEGMGDDVLQVVHPAAPVVLERHRAAKGELEAVAVREARKPFVLDQPPLLRCLWVEEVSGTERLLVLVLHHILADERSLALLWDELAAVLTTEPEGVTAKRVPRGSDEQRAQYDDYVAWQLRDERSARESARVYWRRHLTPLPDELALPFERLPGSRKERTTRGRLLVRSVDRKLRDAVVRLAAEAETTRFTIYALAFRLLLQRYAEGQNIAFATPVSRRSHPATASMVGYFLNPLVVFGTIDEARPVVNAARDFDRLLRAARDHGALPFDALAGELAPTRAGGRHPLFQSMFVYQETPPAPKLGKLELEPLTLDLGEAKFELTFFVTEGTGEPGATGGRPSVELAVEYRTDRFDAHWMERLLAHYEVLLGELADDTGQRVAAASLLSRQETEQLHGWEHGEAFDAESMPFLPEQILASCHRAPNAPALVGAGEIWSYALLERRAGAVARELASHGVEPGDRVGLFVERSPAMIAGLLGILWVGAAYVPLDPAYPSARNRDVLDDAAIAAMVSRATLRDHLPPDVPLVDLDTLAAAHGEGHPEPGSRRLTERSDDLPAYLLYTSGSTGRPKGVVITHGNLRASNGARPLAYDRPPGRFLLLPSIAFDSSVAGLFWTLATGGTLVIPGEDMTRDPRQLARLVAEQQVSSLLCVPSLWAAMLNAASGEGIPLLESLELVIVAGESCPAQLVEEHAKQLPRARLVNEYGPTEATVWATVGMLEPGANDPSPSIGRPIPGVRVEVLDSHDRRVPAGIPGEGWIAGPTVAAGYWQRPELDAERFATGTEGMGERRYRTGDRLVWTLDGRLLFLGRVDEQIKLRGFRIEPGEIEAVLRELSGVEEVAVVARASGRLVAFARGDGEADGWRQALAGRLPEQMLPSRLVWLAELPRLPNGKIDRGRLREMPLESPATERHEAQVASDVERTLVALWEGLLGRGGISRDDNFFELGGHSLLVAEMAGVIARDLATDLSPNEIFRQPTIRQLARAIEERGERGGYEHLFPIQPSGRGTPIAFCVPHFFLPVLARRFRGERPVYGLRGVSLRQDGNRGRWKTMNDLGRELADETVARFPDRPLIVAGYSFGAGMAFEMTRQLEARGVEVERLLLIAPMPLDIVRLGPLRFRLDGLRQPVESLSLRRAVGLWLGGHHPFDRRPYRRLRDRLLVRPWRRLLCWWGDLLELTGRPRTSSILHADVRLERFRLHAEYRPGRVISPVTFFNAREPATDAAATWRPHFEGGFEVIEIPDPHGDETAIHAVEERLLEYFEERSC